MENTQQTIFNGLSITPSLRNKMQTIADWAKICAICAFVSQALSLIVGIKRGDFLSGIIGTAIVVFLNVLLINFATKLSESLKMDDEGLLIESFSNLRRYYLVTGILMIIVSIFVLLAVAFFAVAGSSRF